MEKYPVLNSSNYFVWSKSTSVILQSKGYSRFIQYQGFNEWFQENHQEEQQEVRYKERLRVINDNIALNVNQKNEAIIVLEDRFHADLGRWSSYNQKQRETWNKESEMCKGLILSLINDNFKSKVKEVESVCEIWNILKRESSSNELGNALILFRQLIDIRIKDGEKLSTFLNRFELLIEKLREHDDAFMFPQILQVFLIVCSLPEEYSIIAQSISCLNKDDFTLDIIRNKFGLEDSRREAKVRVKSEDKKEKKVNANFVKKNTSDRKCEICKKVLPSFVPAKFKSCKDCYLKEKEKKDKEKEVGSNNNSNKKEKSHYVVLSSNMSQSLSTSSNNWIMDSGTSSSISNSKDDFDSLESSSSTIFGPLGVMSRNELKFVTRKENILNVNVNINNQKSKDIYERAFNIAMKIFTENDPKSFNEVLKSENKSEWIKSMDAEINSLTSMNTWKDVDNIPKDTVVVDTMDI
jgi:hypothetical protein